MSLHQNSNDRRRRVLNEELNSAFQGDAAPTILRSTTSSAVRKMEKYTEAAQMHNQPRLTDLVPSRYLTLSLIAGAGLLVIATLQLTYAFLPQITPRGFEGNLGLLDLALPSSLAAWFSSVVLMLCGLTALLVYWLRRAKVDDYKGRYRIWMWVALGCLAMSIDETAGIRHAYQSVMTYSTGKTLHADGQLWWVATWSSLMFIVGVWLVLDAKSCRGSTTFFVLAGLLWCGASATHLGLTLESARDTVMLNAGLHMGSYLMLLVAMSLHARYIILDVQGLLPVRESKPKKEPKAKKAKAVSDDSGTDILKMESARKASDRRTDLDPPTPAQPIKKQKEAAPQPAKPAASQQPQDDLDMEDLLEPSGGNHKMSRADRKKLRREQAEQRKAG